MDSAKQHWQILRQVPDKLARKVREFMVIGDKGDGVLLLTEDGDGYWLGEMRFGRESKQATEPTRLDVPNLASMAHGNGHILLLDKNGQIHAMGENYYGQLGLTISDYNTYFSPQLISSRHKFISVRCGIYHNLALTENGKVWAWGFNIGGEVEVPTPTTRSHLSFHQISQLNRHRVIAIECGGAYSLALTDQGEVYGWGWNEWTQLDHEDGAIFNDKLFIKHLHTPTRIPTPSSIKSIAAGDRHTLLLTQTGEVYAFGANKSGQLGIPIDTESRSSLVKVDGLPVISHIASHFFTNISIAITAERKCFVWGNVNKKPTATPLQLPLKYSTLDSVHSFRSSQRNTPYSVRVEGLQRTDPQTPTVSPIGLGERASQIFDNPNSNPDVKFELGDQSILAHRSVLQSSSGHFERLFSEPLNFVNLNPPTSIPIPNRSSARHTTNPSEPDPQIPTISPHSQTPLITISIPDHSYPTYHAYLQFLYTGILQVPIEHLTELFELAHSHLESDLSELCLVSMRSTLSPENCCLYYQLTERYPLPEFQEELVHFIADNIFQVFLTSTYQWMNPSLCKKLTISVGNLYQ